MLEVAVRPRGPYALALSVRGDATRRTRDGIVAVGLPGGGSAVAWQRRDGRVVLRAADEEALERLRFMLAVDDDHSPFLRRFRRDPLLAPMISRLPWLRPHRLATVAHALLRAFCGQLIEARRAHAIERRIVRAADPARPDDEASGSLHSPPTAADLARLAPAQLRSHGLHARRAAAIVRICRELDVERLKHVPTDVVVERLERERGIGPWSVGVVCLEGLGRPERGLVGDLALVKLCAAISGRWVEPWETAELLQPYGEWQGLASVYLMAAFHRGLVPGAIHSPHAARRTSPGRSRSREDRRGADRRPAEVGVAAAR